MLVLSYVFTFHIYDKSHNTVLGLCFHLLPFKYILKEEKKYFFLFTIQVKHPKHSSFLYVHLLPFCFYGRTVLVCWLPSVLALYEKVSILSSFRACLRFFCPLPCSYACALSLKKEYQKQKTQNSITVYLKT